MFQEKLNVTVSFEGELAKYLKDIAEIDNVTVEEMLVRLVTEALEEDIECTKMIEELDLDNEKLIRAEDVDWDKVLSKGGNEKGKQKYKISYSEDVLKKDFPAIPATIRSEIMKKIETKLTTDPLKAGIPLRGKVKRD